MLNSLIIAFLDQETAIIDHAIANLSEQIKKTRGISHSFNFRVSLIALTSTM
ncbi:hypothetical protein [Nostoc sp. NOS(2021)]|uniref:hypothetical protein n=1 Tax=Nostoc sp. NOS(2021) TaxID=2815407 RepID=UPI0025EDC995|nr:hypothetical protein [Nostoc sp. NOS(2021)]